jgi:excisionase family DNA binding protein
MSSATLEPLAYRIEDAARLVGISIGSLRRLVQRGEIPVVRWNASKNARILIKRDDLERFLEGAIK